MHDLVIRNGTVVDGTGRPRFTGDVAIDGGIIAAVGTVAQRGRREIDAPDLLVTPGWVDVHTHYDGQVTWDPILAPSSWHGVTTLVMGNCGVGFAPVRPRPGGLPHRADGGRRGHPRHGAARGHRVALGVVPRVPRRAGADAARARRRRAGAALRDARLRARRARARPRRQRRRDRRDGAPHRGGDARRRRRLLHLAHDPAPLAARPRAGHAFDAGRAARRSAARSARPATACSRWCRICRARSPICRGWSTSAARPAACITFALAQSPMQPHAWRETLARIDELAATGLRIVPQVPCRPTGMLYGLQSSLHPFITHPTYRRELAASAARRARRAPARSRGARAAARRGARHRQRRSRAS